MKEFENIGKNMEKNINWSVPVLKPYGYVEKWCILLWTKVFQPFSMGIVHSQNLISLVKSMVGALL